MENQILMDFDFEEKLPSLFIICNGKPCLDMTPKEIFDINRFTVFYGVSYVASPKFFSEIVSGFQSTTFILGIDDSKSLNKFEDTLEKIFLSPEDGVVFFNNLSEKAKEDVVREKINIRYGKVGTMIHDKIYLLSNEETGDYRVVIGSANLSMSAFHSDNSNYENIRIDDSKELYDIYFERYQKLLGKTNDYIPERTKRKYKEEKTIITIDSEEKLDSLLDRAKENQIEVYIDKEYEQKISDRIEHEKLYIQRIDLTKKLIDATTKKAKNGSLILKTKEELKNKKLKIRGYFSKTGKSSKEKNEQFPIEELFFHNGFLHKKINDCGENQSLEMASIYSKEADMKTISNSFGIIDTFVKSYYDLSLNPNREICSKAYESILYLFASAYIWRIKQLYAEEYGNESVCDIPSFLVLGGISGSGKSTLLKFLAHLVGLTDDFVEDYAKDLKTAGILVDRMEGTSNLYPIFADELTHAFFQQSGTSTKTGETFIKRVSNQNPEKPMPALIGTTNHSSFSSSSQVVRRIYYLSFNNKFDEAKKIESLELKKNLYRSIDDSLFRDFTYRFGMFLKNKDEVFKVDDFLFLARKIFMEYYSMVGRSVPETFPLTIFHDYANQKSILWRQLYFYNREFFVEQGNDICVNVNKLVEATEAILNKRKELKEKIMNFIDESCINTEKSVGVYLFLKKDLFFKFIEYEKNPVKRAVSNMIPSVRDRIKNLFG